jgi:predicted ribonuclease YlaK
MHDPSSLFRFEEHDIYLPMMTLEELDNHKKGMSEVARNARTVSRTLDQLVEVPTACSTKGCRWPSSAIAMPRASCSSRRA